MAEIVCFISSKGGSGKTVTSSSLGTFLSALGFRVLLVDTDASTNGMTLLYLEQLLGRRPLQLNRRGVGLFEARAGVTPSRIEIDDTLQLVPATFALRDTEQTELAQFDTALRAIIRDAEEYDFVLLDAQAGTDPFARAAAEVSDQCVIVSEYDPVSAQGIDRLKIIFESTLKPSATWILFNKVLPEFASAIGDGLAVARYLTPIPWDADVVRAFAKRDLAINMTVPNPYTLAISQVAYNLFPDETGDAIELWRDAAIKSITTPVEERLDELNRLELHLLRGQRVRSLYRNVLSMSFTVTGMLFFSIFALYIVAGKEAIQEWFINLTARGSLDQLITPLMALTLGAFFAVSASQIIPIMLGRNGSPSDDLSRKLLDDERAKLKTSLAAAEASSRFNSGPGYYERRRRAPPPDDISRSSPPAPTSKSQDE